MAEKQHIAMTPARDNIRVQKLVVVIGLVLFIVKMVAWYITNSVAILTDALESTVNVVASFIGLYSLNLSAKPRDTDHPYGHGKVEFISAGIEGTLISVAGLLIIYEAIDNLRHPRILGQLDYGILLIAIAAAVNFATGSLAVIKGKKNDSLALIASGRHLQSDTYTTIGIIAGLLVLYFTGMAWLDSAVALIFALLIIFTGYKILRSSVAGIMDEADQALLDELVTNLNEHRKDSWIDIHNLRIIKYGAVLHLDFHLTLPWYLNVQQAHEEVAKVETLVKSEFGESMEMFVHTDGCLAFSCPLCSVENCTPRKAPFQHHIKWTVANISTDSQHRYGQHTG